MKNFFLIIVGVAVLLGGVAMIAFDGFSFTRKKEVIDAGPVEADVEKRETIDIPAWVAWTSVAVGAGLCAAGVTIVAKDED